MCIRDRTYRDKKIKPLFLQIKNKVAVMAAQVKELTKEVEGWKRKYQKVKQKYNAIQRELDDIRKDNQKLSEEDVYKRQTEDCVAKLASYMRKGTKIGVDKIWPCLLYTSHLYDG